jgi:hypothetical protein
MVDINRMFIKIKTRMIIFSIRNMKKKINQVSKSHLMPPNHHT